MSSPHAAFSGSIPAVYDACLGPVLFEVPARDLAERVARAMTGRRLLELACGTGISTQFLREGLPPEVEIVATDLNPGMLDFARAQRGGLAGVRYQVADALALPYDADAFDAVACQFGIMFFPDRAAGLAEMRRVLRPGGFVACNVWDTLEANPAAGITHETVARYFDAEPPRFLQVPFGSCAFEPTLALFREQGFERMEGHVVEFTVERPFAAEVARGFVEGNPGILEIRERARVEPGVIVEAVAEELRRAFGPEPLRIPLREFVFSGHAPG